MPDLFSERWNALSLRSKMTGVSVFLLTLGLLVAGAGSATVLRNYLTDQVDSRVSAQLKNLDLSIFDFADDGTTCRIGPTPTEYFVAIYTATGTQICSNETEGHDFPTISTMSLTEARDNDLFTAEGATKGTQWRAASGIVVRTTDGALYPVVVGLSLSDTDQLVARFTAIFLFFGLTVVVLGGALTRLLVTSTFGPLREVEATAARFASGDFTQRLGGATPNTEVGRLNRSLNAMLNRIDRLFADRAKTIEQMRRFVGDASHELRTPLVSVRGYAELYRMGALPNDEAVAQAMERIEKEAIRMSELVTDLLELARIDETKPLQLAEVDLVEIARDAALDAMASAPDRVVNVVVSEGVRAPEEPVADGAPESANDPAETATPTRPIRFAGATIARLRRNRAKAVAVEPAVSPLPLPVPASRKIVIVAEENKVRQVVTNLMGNAMRFTPDGSPIEIGVGIDGTGANAEISIIDHGEGIPEQIRDKIFQRFWRADSSRTRDTGGSGLGLAIVASIVSAHKGRIDVVETPGGGATFRVSLPVLPRTPEAEQSTRA